MVVCGRGTGGKYVDKCVGNPVSHAGLRLCIRVDGQCHRHFDLDRTWDRHNDRSDPYKCALFFPCLIVLVCSRDRAASSPGADRLAQRIAAFRSCGGFVQPHASCISGLHLSDVELLQSGGESRREPCMDCAGRNVCHACVQPVGSSGSIHFQGNVCRRTDGNSHGASRCAAFPAGALLDSFADAFAFCFVHGNSFLAGALVQPPWTTVPSARPAGGLAG